jgi:Ca2+-binding EF-hand superfamily protein
MDSGSESDDEETANLREVFRVCDLDNNGSISLSELILVIKQSGAALSDEEIATVFGELDGTATRSLAVTRFF